MKTPPEQQRTEPSGGSDDQLTTDQFVEKLRAALRKDGDFPASAKIVNELRMLTSDPRTTAQQVTEVILREPSLGTRILHLVNSSFYQRSKPIMTVTQAVVQIGMKPLAELCAGLVLLQKFVPLARRGGAFATCLQRTILTSLLSSSLAGVAKPAQSSRGKADECGYLAGSFAELGTLLLAYYFPQIYEASIKRSESKHVSLAQGIFELTGLTPLDLSVEVVHALDLPPFYRNVLLAARNAQKNQSAGKGAAPAEQNDISRLASSVTASRDISEVITTSRSKGALDEVIKRVTGSLAIESRNLETIVGELPFVFKKQCESIELTLPALPEYVASYLQIAPEEGEAPATLDPQSDQFLQYVDEIRQAIEGGESTASIITTVMETFAWNLNFDRVILMLFGPGKRRLLGRLVLGKAAQLDPKSVERPVGSDAGPNAPDANAVREGRPIFRGDPLISDGWPLVALPIGFGQRTIGVIYADRLPPNDAELSSREQAAISVLAELLDRSVSSNGA